MILFPTADDRALLRELNPLHPALESISLADGLVLEQWLDGDFSQRALPHQWSALTATTRETVLVGGRGSGKTRTGAQFIINAVMDGATHVAVVSTTFGTLTRDIISGPAGILASSPEWYKPRFIASGIDPRLVWPPHPVTGKIPRCSLLASGKASTTRGLEVSHLWGDEVSAWHKADEVLASLRFALRGAENVRVLWTLTPSPDVRTAADLALGPVGADGQRRLPETVTVIAASTYANRAALGESNVKDLERRYPPGTRRHDLEILGKISLDPVNPVFERELLNAAFIEEDQVPDFGEFPRIILSVDPSRSLYAQGDNCGAIVSGLHASGTIYVFADVTTSGPPASWILHLRRAYKGYGVHYAVYEQNRLSASTAALIVRDSGQNWFPKTSKGRKFVRLGPVLTLLQEGKLKLVRSADGSDPLDHLVDELVGFDALEPPQQRDDRVDALAQGVSELLSPEYLKW